MPHDVCIIGSGFAGTFLGLRLVERGVRTVIIEAGSQPGAPRDPSAFAYTNSGAVEYPIAASRVIGLGGSSNHWSGLLTRLRPADFEVRSRFGQLSDWPIAYADLEPYYCESERLLSAAGPAPIEDAEPERWCAYPFEQQPAPNLNARIDDRDCSFFQVARSRRDGRGGPVRLLERELPRFRQAAGASLLSGLQVTRLVSTDGRSVDHALAKSADGESLRIRAREFVIAAGVVESARLLLLSQRGDGGARPASGLVGRYFHVHPLLESQRRLRPRNEIEQSIYQTSSLADVYQARGLNACDYQLVGSSRSGLGLRALVATEPRADNRIALSASRSDAFGESIPDLSFAYSERDHRTFSHCGAVLGRHEQSDSRTPIADSYRWHPAGTCRMAASPDEGVVDSNGRVFGVDNLYVSGASTFPNSGVANPTDTVVALTLRLGDHLLARLRSEGWG